MANSADANVAKQGYMEGYLRSVGQEKKWQRRYYVLYEATPHCQPRLDYYPDEISFLKDHMIRKTIYIEEIKSVVFCKNQHERLFCLKINTDSQRDHLLATGSETVAIDWMRLINKVKDQAHRDSDVLKSAEMNPGADEDDDTTFDENIAYETFEKSLKFQVVVQQTDAADRCKLSEKNFSLIIARQYMSLVLNSDPSVMFTWPYRYIRRYGRNKISFTFEAGRKCASGPGMFTLKTQEGQKIFQEIRELTKTMRQDGDDEGPAAGGACVADDNKKKAEKAEKHKSAEENLYSKDPALPHRGYRNSDSAAPPPPPVPSPRPRGHAPPVPAGAKSIVPAGAKSIVPAGAKSVVPASAKSVVPAGAKSVVPAGAKLVVPAGAKLVIPDGLIQQISSSLDSTKKSPKLGRTGSEPGSPIEVTPAFGKVRLVNGRPGDAYGQVYEAKRLDVEEPQQLPQNAGDSNHEYALYDYRASSRFSATATTDQDYAEIDRPGPATAGRPTPGLLAALRGRKVQTEPETYSHLNIGAGQIPMISSQRPLPQTPVQSSDYELAGGYNEDLNNDLGEHVYDEVGRGYRNSDSGK